MKGGDDLYPGYQIALDLAGIGEEVIPFVEEGLKSRDATTRKW